MKNKNQILQNPKRGMRIKALYIGKMVGNCIVDRVDADKAYLLVRGDEGKKTSKVVSSSINSRNGAVECLEGNTIQCTEYYES